MGVNKTISLDRQTAIIADRMPNFSGFVRNALLKYARTEKKKGPLSHTVAPSARVWGPSKDKCNPKHKNGCCGLCWSDEWWQNRTLSCAIVVELLVVRCLNDQNDEDFVGILSRGIGFKWEFNAAAENITCGSSHSKEITMLMSQHVPSTKVNGSVIADEKNHLLSSM